MNSHRVIPIQAIKGRGTADRMAHRFSKDARGRFEQRIGKRAGCLPGIKVGLDFARDEVAYERPPLRVRRVHERRGGSQAVEVQQARRCGGAFH